MISRSESLPITIETSTLLISPLVTHHSSRAKLCSATALEGCPSFQQSDWRPEKKFCYELLFQSPRRNILPVMCALKTNLPASLIRPPDRCIQITSPCRHS